MKIKTKLFLIFFAFTFFLMGVMSYFFYRDISKTKFEEIRNNAISIASSVSLLINEQVHSKLLKPEDMKSKDYQEIRDRLRNLQKCFPQIRYVYTMVKTGKPDIWKFIIDATEPKDENGDGKISELEGTTMLGEEFDVSPYPEMQQAFSGASAGRHIEQDKWGWFLSAYSPLYNSKGMATAIVGIDVSAKTIQQERDKLKKRIFVIFGFSVIISLIMSAILSSSVISPVLKVIKTSKLISEGKYETIIADKRKDEIGELILSINEMSKNIKRTVDKLKTLNRTSEILAITLDLEEALKLSINLLLEILNASKGIILLLNRSENMFALGTFVGIGTAKVVEQELFIETSRIGLSADRDFIEHIKANPDVYTISEIEKIPKLSQPKEWLAKTNMISFAPLVIKQDLVGCILIDVEIRDKEFFKTLTNQIAMSLENARLYHEAIVDGLTGLYVHKYFQLQLLAELRRSQRFKKSFSVLMIDIDHFKKFNDIYGHQAGDFVLKEVSKIMKLLTRSVDVVARYGGEEIAVILPETDIAGAKKIAEKIRSKIEEYQFKYQDKLLNVTVSIGAAEWSAENPLEPETLITSADKSLYRAKEEGRNRVCA